MVPSENKQPKKSNKNVSGNSDCSSSDNDADKTGTDKNSDATHQVKQKENEGLNKFDKPKREPNPDRTGIDTESDKTKKEK